VELDASVDGTVIIDTFVRALIRVVSRRTSGGYAMFTVEHTLSKLAKNFDILHYVDIKSNRYAEAMHVITVDPEMNRVSSNEVRRAVVALIQETTEDIGKYAGYFFIKEVKEELPNDFEREIRQIGIDLDLMQLDYITEKKKVYKLMIPHSEVLSYVLTAILAIVEQEVSRDAAFRMLSELVKRLSISYEVLQQVELYDTRYVQQVKTITVSSKVDQLDTELVASTLQKIIQEVDTLLGEQYGVSFIEKLRQYLTFDYLFRLEGMGVNLQVIPLRQSLVVKQVITTIVNVLAVSSSESYAVLVLDRIIHKMMEKEEVVSFVTIDSTRLSDGLAAVSIPQDVDTVSIADLGRSLQKCLESIIVSLGESAGKEFLEKFKNQLGKAYLLRMEKMGVNLHIIEIKQHMLW
jgi:hypothetical protein